MISRFLIVTLVITSFLPIPSIQAQHPKGSSAGRRYENSQTPSDLNKGRPIAAHDTVFVEEMTWMEVRDALNNGKSTVIIATGGIEQNGPYLALGKHNFVLRQDCEAIARRLGNALVAPIIPFVPEGHHQPKTHHMRYPGTISISEETFESLLIEIATSFKIHGFKHILLLGDSGDNQFGMDQVARKLSTLWKESGTSIHYIAEYYAPGEIDAWLKERGIHEIDEGLHDRFRYEAQIATLDPTLIRLSQRRAVGLASINGINLLPIEKTQSIGWQLIEYQATRTTEAIQRRLEQSKR